VPEHNALKYAIDITRGYKRFLGIDDAEQGTTRVSETIYPTVELAAHPEFDFPVGINRWSVTPSQGATVGEFSQVGVANPAGSGFIIVVDACEFVATGTQTWEERIGANFAFTSTGVPLQRDTRISANFANPGLITQSVANHNAARQGSLAAAHNVNNSIWGVWYLPVVLSPGFFFLVGTNTANVAAQANFYGREYRANPGELLTI
jgi:hypothetical protein